ncbi:MULTISPECIES: threonine--tRNA ligase [Methanobacterium]|jgi:threonyl-tRNA synthetase|uniref:Threonine--tRNA ligase n=1 Tax=Methanobacterium formicicum TaxID=2162 RepID=A0A090I8V0_METFO|nr:MULTISPECIES: threonine--tRNA ligase [Methanobacterium]KUK75208.1 MAG: Threonine--tRNA ligase [Methanobacterium sp. 42_16]MDH2659588.1 threonine--tRNA ligase [Methanobacterium formicicum]CEA13687.1 Threonine-tRNA ligase [Methanobacterium formicicum]
MRILLIHSDHLKYQTKSKTRIAEEIGEEKKKGQFENALVVFTAVEKEDEKNPTAVVDNAVKEIMDVAGKIKAENIVIYPYAHLSSSLGAPDIAKDILANMESALLSRDLPVSRVPFGWYKAFEVSCKGHPLSELSRSISSEVTEDVKEESEEEESQFYILNKGELLDIEDYTYQSEDLEKLVDYELGRGESTGEEPPHVKLMREKKLADYEPSADVGHLRWYPKGRLIRDLLSDYVYTLVTDRGAMPVETPIMYDLADEAIRVHAEKFGERQYRMTSGKKDLMLRFAACFGAFRILADSFLTWKNLPVGIYELSTYSFRLEKKGEVVGLKRLRGFTMPDLHTVCSDVEQSLQEFESQIEMCKGTGEDLDVNYEVIFRATADFMEENREWINQAAARIGKPVLMEILPKRKHYWICKMDFAALDALGRPIENPTIQIDVESGERFGITYIDSEEKEHHPYILHCSPTGSIERVICSLLEKSALDMKDKVPMLPVWLAPTQVRVIPIAERHNEYAHKLAQQIEDARIRVDVDDRPETVGKKIRNAGGEWVSYVIVIGDREMEAGSELTVNVRETGQKVSMGLQELIEVIQLETKGMPFRPLPLPVDLSRRVNF